MYENSKQVDSYRQILASVEYDVRAVLVKVADRLHNMRTLDSMRPDKQMKIAGETDYFYAPLANRLGLYDIKTELENLSFRFRCPQDYGDMVLLIEKQKEAEKAKMDAFIQNVRQVLDAKDIKVRIELQYRSPYSLWRKMQAKGCDFNHVDGVTASFYNDDVQVLTPKGDGIILPKGATALDFAFEIHTEVGFHAVYAHINGRLCSL